VEPLIGLLGVIVVGLAVGRLSILGVSFGTSAILFVAIVAGHYGLKVSDGFGQLGLAVFVYSVGISAGPTFFRGLASRGRSMAIISAAIVMTGGLVAWGAARVFSLPPDLTGGLMAGAMTSTPALGAITQHAANASEVAVGFGVAYSIGIVSVVLFVQIALRMLRPRPVEANQAVATLDPSRIQRLVVEIVNPVIVGSSPSDVDAFANSACQISRIRIDNRWRPLPPRYRFCAGDRLMLVGTVADSRLVAQTLGTVQVEGDVLLDADRERKSVVVTSPDIYGRSLKELSLRSRYGVTVVRIRRHELEFVPSGQTVIDFGDTLTLVGESEALAKMESVMGHRPRALVETDLLSLIGGIAIGILVGTISVDAGPVSMSLGLAGGPLVVGLILGHFRRIGPIRGSFPPAAQLLLTEGGLALFLADAGIDAGADLLEVLSNHGLSLVMTSFLIATVPMLVGFLIARHRYQLDILQTLGATCGGMTSTPGLAVLTDASDSSECVTSYVAAYPVALVLITLAAPILVQLLGG